MSSTEAAASTPSNLTNRTASAGHSSLYDIYPTRYGGRGAFASKAIPKGTVILDCEGPYASVVLRKYRREVCGWCFAWSLEKLGGRKGTWSVRLDVEVGGSATAGQWTPWFCGGECRTKWVDAYFSKRKGAVEGEDSRDVGGVVNIMGVLEKTLVNYKNTKIRSKGKEQKPSSPVDSTRTSFAFMDAWKREDVSQESIDRCWELAETTMASLKGPKILELLEAWNEETAEDPTDLLTEFEADCARFVLDGLLRRSLETIKANEVSQTSSQPGVETPGEAFENVKEAGQWPDFLELQDNELATIKAKPYMIGFFVHVYMFLKCTVLSSRAPRKRSQNDMGTSGTVKEIQPHPGLVEVLVGLLETSESVRAILGRDDGNVFGIWDKGSPTTNGGEYEAESSDDSEMLGWAAYVFGSYFNHDCEPNVMKMQDGRSLRFITTQDVVKGEELCINYIDVSKGNGVVKRNEELAKEWYFECGCARCSRERVEGESVGIGHTN